MTETLPWYGYLFLTLVGLIVLVVGGILLIAIFDAVRLARLKRSPRFQRVEKRELFKQEDLPAIGKKIEMELVDGVPYETRKAVLKTVGPLGTGDLSDILQRTNGDGTLSLCNIQRVVARKRSHRDGSAPTNYTEIYEFTCLVFQGNEDSIFPVLNLQPNVHSVMEKLHELEHDFEAADVHLEIRGLEGHKQLSLRCCCVIAKLRTCFRCA